MIDTFGLKLTMTQYNEMLLVSTNYTRDFKQFSLDDLTKWLAKSMPLLHEKDSGFKLPK